MIWRVFYNDAPWATVVVRAPDAASAERLGKSVGGDYMGNVGTIEVEALEQDGPTESLIEDWS